MYTMTAKQLIAQLKKCDKNANIKVYVYTVNKGVAKGKAFDLNTASFDKQNNEVELFTI